MPIITLPNNSWLAKFERGLEQGALRGADPNWRRQQAIARALEQEFKDLEAQGITGSRAIAEIAGRQYDPLQLEALRKAKQENDMYRKIVESQLGLEGAQTQGLEASTRGQAIRNQFLPQQSQAELDQTRAGTNLTNEKTRALPRELELRAQAIENDQTLGQAKLDAQREANQETAKLRQAMEATNAAEAVRKHIQDTIKAQETRAAQMDRKLLSPEISKSEKYKARRQLAMDKIDTGLTLMSTVGNTTEGQSSALNMITAGVQDVVSSISEINDVGLQQEALRSLLRDLEVKKAQSPEIAAIILEALRNVEPPKIQSKVFSPSTWGHGGESSYDINQFLQSIQGGRTTADQKIDQLED